MLGFYLWGEEQDFVIFSVTKALRVHYKNPKVTEVGFGKSSRFCLQCSTEWPAHNNC